MRIDKVALLFVIIAFSLWALMMLFGLLAFGSWALLVLVPILAIAYLFGVVVSQRLRSREDDYYDRIE